MNIELITFDNKFNRFFDNKIKIINSRNYSKTKISKYYKYFFCLILLIKRMVVSKNIYIFAFQANIYCIFLAFLFNKKIITRSNSSPSGWSNNFLKNLIFYFSHLKKLDIYMPLTPTSSISLSDGYFQQDKSFSFKFSEKFGAYSIMSYHS